MTITRTFKLCLNAGTGSAPYINVNQYDKNEVWLFELYNEDGTRYTPSSGAIIGLKADGHAILNNGTVDSEGRVVITETEQMTAAAGRAVYELLIDNNTHGTANFVVKVEERPTDEAEISDSDLSLIQQAIDSTNPQAIAEGVSDWMSEHLTPTTPVIDDTLTVSGAAADAKATGDRIAEIEVGGDGLTSAIKSALLQIAQKVAYIDEYGQTYYDALYNALYPPADLVSISAVYTQSGTVYDTDSLEDLKTDLVVTANMSDGTSETVTTYTLSGTLTEGTSTITVSYGGKTTTFNVTVSSLWLYNLASPFTSTGDNQLDTNIQLQTGKTYTFLVDFLISETHSASGSRKVDFIYSNKVGEDDQYIGLQTISTGLWGMGIAYGSKKTVGANKQYRNVAVVTINADGSCSISNKNKNVTDGTAIQSSSNTYATGNAINSATYFLGKANDATTTQGFNGTVNDFKIFNGEMSATDINDYLTNGAS